MIKKILLVAVISLTAINLQAKEITGAAAFKLIPGAVKVITSDKTGDINFIFLQQGNEVALPGFEKWLKAVLHTGKEFGLKTLQTSVDKKNISHIHYQETWNGVPVANTMWIAHMKDGKVMSCNGWVVADLDAGVSVSMNEATALTWAMSDINAKTYRWQSPAYGRLNESDYQQVMNKLYPKGELYFASVNGDNKNFRLCYRFDVHAIVPLSRNYVFVDANTGVIVNKISRIHEADAVGTAVTGYVGTQTIITDSFAGGYRLREASRGDGVETYNCETGTDYATAVDFTDTDNMWNNVNANLDQYATDAHYGAEMTYDYYWFTHNRNSVDDNGMKLLSYVHYDVGYYNAFWDGQEMTYGDGTGGPLTALDVCGHEISHGVTEWTCGLNYQDEPGGMNEGYSDCIGTAVEFYAGGATADWLIGEDFGTPFRSMSDPNAYDQPDTYEGTFWHAPGGSDNGGVHTNSGVLNYWFYLMSVGDAGTNDNGYTYNIAGLSMAQAAEILYKAWTDYMFANAQYADCRTATLNAASDIYGGCSPEVQMVAEAWHAVGVGGAFDPTVLADFSVDITTSCSAPADFHFQNLSQNGGTYTWHFGDGTTSNAISPTHTYTTYGTFDVELVADGGACGMDSVTQSALIQIDSLLPCIFNMSLNTNTTITACTGSLYDTGGPGGNYSNSEDDTITIAPTNATGLVLTFTSFYFENNYDYMYIYDGPSTASTLLGQFDNNNLPLGGTITASGNALTLRTTSDVGLTYSGFAATFQCMTALPGVDFTSDVQTSCTGTINFIDQTSNSPLTWAWDFGDGGTSTLQNPTHTYATNGTYNVQLIVTNAIGTDSLTQNNFITINMPAGPAVTPGSNCATGTVDLSATGSGGTLNWYDALVGGNLVGTGSTFTTPFLTTTTTYYVDELIQPAQLFVGPVDNTIGAGANYNNTNNDRFQYFDCYQSCELVSVIVYASGTADREFQLLDDAGNVLLDTVINVLDGTQEVFLNWILPVGNDLQIGVLATANLYRNSDGAVYPYTLPGFISVTGNNANDPVRWYFLYNWKIQPTSCVSVLVPVVATIGNLDATITPVGTIDICEGDNVTIDAAAGAATYLWSNSATTQSITVSSAGNYSVVVTNGTGCTGTSQTLTVNVNPTPVAAFTETHTQLSYAFTSSSIASTYDWDFGDGNTGTGQNPTHDYTAEGLYTVTLIVCNGICCDTFTSQYDVKTGIENILSQDGWMIFPNPTMENFNLTYTGNSIVESVSVYNTLGELIWTSNSAGKKSWMINANQFAAGVYFLTAKSADGIKVFKIEKVK